ncbi:hypothetical protein ES705_22538 [subsurface metagenome]
MKKTDLEKRFVELLKTHTWNEAVRILRQERSGILEAVAADPKQGLETSKC